MVHLEFCTEGGGGKTTVKEFQGGKATHTHYMYLSGGKGLVRGQMGPPPPPHMHL